MPYTYSGMTGGGNYGDYYRGDYYRGDPGVLSFLGKAVKGVVGGAVGFVTGGVGGAVRGAAQGLGITLPGQARQQSPVQGTALAPAQQDYFAGASIGGERGIRVGVERSVAVTTTGMGSAPLALASGAQCPKGYHPNKTSYFLNDGTFIAKGSRCVKYRRMNVLNPRALRKGIRRGKGAIKLLRKTSGAMGYSVVAKRAPKLRKTR